MIRFFYWLLAMIELLLILFVILIFILTDARTVKMVADQAISSSKFSYASIEGNFITGLEVNDLKYKDKVLFDVAKLHWNPIALLYKQIELTELDVEGVDIENILATVESLNQKKSKKKGSVFALPMELVVDKVHLDINPYDYEGLTVSDFLLTTDKIKIDDELNIATKNLYLRFNSDIVNVELFGDIDKSKVLITRASLKEISSRGITKLVHIIQDKKHNRTLKSSDGNSTESKRVSKSSVTNSSEPIIKELKVRHIFASMKDVIYGPLSIKGVKLLIDDAEFDTYHSYTYKAKSIKATGSTNFGSVKYKGYIKDSNIYAKGGVLLSKELFKKYSLPLNYKALRRLSGSLHLNHQAVWITVNHKVKNLLKIKSSFNVDITKAKHKLHFNYRDRNLTIESKMRVNMPYGDNVKVNNRVLVNVRKKGYTTYEGDLSIPKVKGLPPEIAEYLLDGLTAKFKGDKDGLLVEADSTLIEGEFVTKGYKNAVVNLKSKARNVLLGKVVPAIPAPFKKELLAFESKSFLDFKHLANSKVNLKVFSNLLDTEINMMIKKPYKILFKGRIPLNSSLQKLNQNINLHSLREISGEVLIKENNYLIRINNKNDLKFYLHYDGKRKFIREGSITLAGEEVYLTSSGAKEMELNLDVKDLGRLLDALENYYNITLPKLKGSVTLRVRTGENGLLRFKVKSPKITYLGESPLDIKEIDSRFTLDNNGNIVIEKYRFRLDTNPYFKDFYAHKRSYLSIQDGKVVIRRLWFNNQAEIAGTYSIESASGDLSVKAKAFPFITKELDLLFDIDAKVKIRKKLIDVDGDINILGNSVHYDIKSSGIAEDADIIVVQEMKENEDSALENLKLYLKIKSEKPLNYYGSDTSIEFYNELRVVKNYKSDMMVTGMSTITKGFYQMEDKRFILNESHIYFAGDVKKPLLDIKANYEKDQYLVHIFISGTTEEPIVNFNSEPYLTQQEILSLILFDGTGSSSGQGAEAYTVLGGTFAKGLMKSLGINVDHLLLGTDANDELSLEVGRKVSKDITIMYMLKDGKNGAKVRIEHNRNFETDIIVQPPNTSSIEFLYKKDR